MAVQTPKLLLERFPNRIRFIFRHFPLQEAHPHALLAAEASEAAAGQGRFWQMHDLLFQNQAHLKERDLYRYAGEIGLDLARYTAEMDDHIYLQRVREHVDERPPQPYARDAGVLPRRCGAGHLLRHAEAARRRRRGRAPRQSELSRTGCRRAQRRSGPAVSAAATVAAAEVPAAAA